MTAIGDLAGPAFRWLHLASSVLLLGGCAALLLAGRSDRATALCWQARIVRGACALVVLALVTGLAAVAHQAAVVEARAAAGLEPAAVWRFLSSTQVGGVWLVRGGVLLILGAFLAMRADLSRRLDWQTARGEALLLSGAALGLLALAGHAAAVEPGTGEAIAMHLAHLLAAGVWLGALPALALLWRAASRDAGADARPYAVVAARRFSRTAAWLVGALVVTGGANTAVQIGSVGALLGTPHGRLLLLKLALFAAMLALGAVARWRWLPALAGEATTVGRPALLRLSRWAGVEAAVGGALLLVVALMTLTPPARHDAPTWPLPFRLTPDMLRYAPELRPQVLVGSQVAVVGVVGLLASSLLRSFRVPVLSGAMVVLLAGLGLALPPLATDAYPTTYRRPDTPYHATAIAAGGKTYREHCAACHGTRGAGDGPAAVTMNPPPSDLRTHHTAVHTAGDLFWWITNGLRQMPAFGDRLDDEQRWDVVNYLRALAAAEEARTLGPEVEVERPRIVAPDASFAVGPNSRSLREYRDRRTVLLVLYTLPGSRTRLAQLAERYDVLVPLGVEVVAVPTDAAADALRRLGPTPRILFPVVTEGAADIVATYGLFTPAPHTEYLIDRQGYLRAITALEAGGVWDPDVLLTQVQRLNEEPATAPPADEHVH